MPDPHSIPVRVEAADTAESWPVESRVTLGEGRLFDYRSDVVVPPLGPTMRRDYLDHTGAVAVIALDDDENVVVVQQYRHPAGFRLIEPPAGLLDGENEDVLETAQRELAEEAGLAAGDWRLLVDIFTTPGSVNESIRIYLARELTSADAPAGFEVKDEEAHMDLLRVPVNTLLEGILAGRLQSPTLVAGVLAYAAARERRHALRPADAPWPARDQLARLRAAQDSERGSAPDEAGRESKGPGREHDREPAAD